MNRQRYRTRGIALLAAYAFALQAVLAGLLPGRAADDFSPALSENCIGEPAADRPVHRERATCALHCLAAAPDPAGLPPPGGIVIASVVSFGVRSPLSVPRPVHGVAAERHPQVPRAPPLA